MELWGEGAGQGSNRKSEERVKMSILSMRGEKRKCGVEESRESRAGFKNKKGKLNANM